MMTACFRCDVAKVGLLRSHLGQEDYLSAGALLKELSEDESSRPIVAGMVTSGLLSQVVSENELKRLKDALVRGFGKSFVRMSEIN